jgi:hypothetical protein
MPEDAAGFVPEGCDEPDQPDEWRDVCDDPVEWGEEDDDG